MVLVDHSVIIQALRKGLTEREASDTGGVPRRKSSCPDRLAEATEHSSDTEKHYQVLQRPRPREGEDGFVFLLLCSCTRYAST